MRPKAFWLSGAIFCFFIFERTAFLSCICMSRIGGAENDPSTIKGSGVTVIPTRQEPQAFR